MTLDTVAIMQPYFLPYAGYFRLLAAADLFVIYDCVQFPRRGWVHRNRLLDATGTERWLTLPLEKAPQSVLIRDLRFPLDAAEIFAERLRPFSLAATKSSASAEPVLRAVSDLRETPVDYIERLLQATAVYCGLRWQVIRSSTLNIPPEVHGQQRILEIAQRLGARRYLNAPGGRDLYDVAAFAGRGIELRFLSEYTGPKISILTRILTEDREELSRDIQLSAKCWSTA